MVLQIAKRLDQTCFEADKYQSRNKATQAEEALAKEVFATQDVEALAAPQPRRLLA